MNQNNMDELLVKYLARDASQAEIQEVDIWISASSANKQHFNTLKLLWNTSADLPAQSSVNEEEAWKRFTQRTKEQRPAPKQIPLSPKISWQRIAAMLVLLAGCAWGGYVLVQRNHQDNNNNVAVTIPSHDSQPANQANPINMHINDDTDQITAVPAKPADNVAPPMKRTIKMDEKAIGFKKHKRPEDIASHNAREVICNGTPCPIEICINQTMQCPDNKPKDISSCSLLEPEQSAKLSYKSHDKIAKNCSLTVEEITITSIATGEAIVLNEHSVPSTAKDLFSYINGEKKGEILAGMFHSDCDKQVNNRGLKFDSKTGNWILE